MPGYETYCAQQLQTDGAAKSVEGRRCFCYVVRPAPRKIPFSAQNTQYKCANNKNTKTKTCAFVTVLFFHVNPLAHFLKNQVAFCMFFTKTDNRNSLTFTLGKESSLPKSRTAFFSCVFLFFIFKDGTSGGCKNHADTGPRIPEVRRRPNILYPLQHTMIRLLFSIATKKTFCSYLLFFSLFRKKHTNSCSLLHYLVRTHASKCASIPAVHVA